jgi:hypothetical protein
MHDDAVDLTEISDLRKALAKRPDISVHSSMRRMALTNPREVGEFSGTFCPACGESRRMELKIVWWPMEKSSGEPAQAFLARRSNARSL